MSKSRLLPFVFTLTCLALAAIQSKHPLDKTVIGLVLLSILPWSIQWIAPLVKSLKVAGVEVDFKEMQAQVQANKEAIQAAGAALASGIGKMPDAPPAALSHATPAARDEDDLGPGGGSPPKPATHPLPAEANGYKLSATVKPFPGSNDLFMVHAWVGPVAAGTPVVFHLHHSFRPPDVRVIAQDAVAAIDRVTWGAFTIAADVAGTRLSLNLANLAGAPDLFRSR